MVQKIASPGRDEFLPHPTGIILPMIAEYMEAARQAEGPKPTAIEGTTLRASQALMCARAVGLAILKVPETEAVPFETLLAFDIGDRFHKAIQEIAAATLDARAEVIGDYSVLGIPLSCHADLVYERKLFNPVGGDVEERVVGEIKTVSGYGFLVSTGARKSDEGAGPKDAHVCQAAICANAPNILAKKIHMIYVDKDKNSIAEWMMDMDTPYPRYEGMTPREMAENEVDRQTKILGRIQDGLVPARHVPGYGRVEVVPDPDSRDQPWQCRYCRHNTVCKQFDSRPFPIDQLVLGGFLEAAE